MMAAEKDSASALAEVLLENPNSRLVIVGQILCILVPLAVWFSPLPLEPVTKHGFAIVGFMVVAWITRAMDYALAGLVGCFLFWALGVVRQLLTEWKPWLDRTIEELDLYDEDQQREATTRIGMQMQRQHSPLWGMIVVAILSRELGLREGVRIGEQRAKQRWTQ
jgi:di/tricarboxylate transporter